jgi:hypothetical protein
MVGGRGGFWLSAINLTPTRLGDVHRVDEVAMALDPVAERSVRIVVIHGLGVGERARVRRFGGAVHGELLNRVNRLAIGLNAFEGVGACDRLNKESHGLIHIKRDHGRGNSHSENARSDRKTEHLGAWGPWE